MFNSKKRVKDMAAPGTSNAPAPSAGNAEKLEIAKRLALRINAQKNLGAEAQVFVPFHFKVRLYKAMVVPLTKVVPFGSVAASLPSLSAH